jgi:hypothetical protein
LHRAQCDLANRLGIVGDSPPLAPDFLLNVKGFIPQIALDIPIGTLQIIRG